MDTNFERVSKYGLQMASGVHSYNPIRTDTPVYFSLFEELTILVSEHNQRLLTPEYAIDCRVMTR
jgi:hypothetical protein